MVTRFILCKIIVPSLCFIRKRLPDVSDFVRKIEDATAHSTRCAPPPCIPLTTAYQPILSFSSVLSLNISSLLNVPLSPPPVHIPTKTAHGPVFQRVTPPLTPHPVYLWLEEKATSLSEHIGDVWNDARMSGIKKELESCLGKYSGYILPCILAFFSLYMAVRIRRANDSIPQDDADARQGPRHFVRPRLRIVPTPLIIIVVSLTRLPRALKVTVKDAIHFLGTRFRRKPAPKPESFIYGLVPKDRPWRPGYLSNLSVLESREYKFQL
ncbi:hypothetical protein FRC03_004203 [Tulasnella sp. 419]|nr:hypothetical protein FRC03_004203 [Tulasnella sp. 419]